MKPVEIEFLMRDKLSAGVAKGTAEVEKLGAAADASSRNVEQGVARLKGVAAQLESEISGLRSGFAQLDESVQTVQAQAQLEACTATVREQAEALTGLEKEQEQVEGSTQRMTTRLRQLQNQLMQLEAAGQANTAEFAALAEEAGALADGIGDIRQRVQHLADDNANLTAFADGVNGIAGAFTAATGVMSLFAGENEDLVRIQAKLQSVMAVTMGLQQVYNTLNKDSAFRVIGVTRAKELLTSANTRLAAALGISTAAATALTAALSLGLTLAIAAAIKLWDEFSSRQEEAARKMKETIEVEHDARMVREKARLEIEQSIAALKEFNGTKEEERQKVEELNRKYGESFGYHKTTSGWYDVLIGKGQAYAQTLFLQAKMQTLANKAAAAQVEADELRASDPDRAGTAMPWYQSGLRRMAAAFANRNSFTAPTVEQEIREENRRRRDAAVKELEATVAEAKREMEATREEMIRLDRLYRPSGHASPALPVRSVGNEAAAQLASDTKAYTELQAAASEKIARNFIALTRDEYARRRAQAKWEHSVERAAIERQAEDQAELYRRLRKSGAAVAPDALDNIAKTRAQLLSQADELHLRAVAEINAQEQRVLDERAAKEQETFRTILSQHRDYNARRVELQQDYARQMKILDLGRTAGNAPEVDAAKIQATKNLAKALRAVDDEEMETARKTAPLLVALYEDAGQKSRSELRTTMAQTRALIDYLRTTKAEDITPQFGFTAQQLRTFQASPEQLKAMGDALEKLKGQLEGSKHPLEKFTSSLRTLFTQKADENRRKQALKDLGQTSLQLGGQLSQSLRQLSTVYKELDEGAAASLESMADFLDGAKNLAQGFLQNGWVGGVMAAVGELFKAFTSHAVARAEVRKEQKRLAAEALAVEREHQAALYETALAYERLKTLGADAFGKAANAAQLAIERQRELAEAIKGTGRVQTEQGEQAARLPKGMFEKARRELLALHNAQQQQWGEVAGLANIRIKVGAHKESSGFLGLGRKKVDDYGSILARYPQLIDAAGKFDRRYAEKVLSEAQFKDEAAKAQLAHFIELAKQEEAALEAIDSYLEGVFGSTTKDLSTALVDAFRNGSDAAEAFGGSVEKMLERLAEDMAFSATFADDIERAGQRVREIGRDTNLSAEQRMQQTAAVYAQLTAAISAEQAAYDAMLRGAQGAAGQQGFDLFKADEKAQQARAGDAFRALTQDQGTKLEGLFTAGQMHWASIDRTLAASAMDIRSASATLLAIKEDTVFLRLLRPMDEKMERLLRDGLKIK